MFNTVLVNPCVLARVRQGPFEYLGCADPRLWQSRIACCRHRLGPPVRSHRPCEGRLAGASLCKQNNIDFIVAVGGGSVIDCSKAIAAGAASDLEPWDLVMNPGKIEKALPLFTVLTLSATGSEYDNSALNNSPLKREGFDKIRTLQTSVLPPICRHPDHETLSDAALGRSGVSFPAAGIA